MKTRLLATLVAASLFIPMAAQAAIVPVNHDPAGVGLNDPTARAPEGGNPGTTVGDQRKIVYQFAADLWGSILTTNVDVRVGASFAALSCTATGGTLGSAGAWWIWQDPAFPVPGAWYHQALANQVAGENLNVTSGNPDYVAPDDIEIGSQFNANLGQPNCLAGSGWYYGLDGNTPAGMISFLDVVMHEIGHGLGFSGFIDKSTGALANYDGVPRSDVYTHYAYDNVKGLRFDAAGMANADRLAAITTQGRSVWDGAIVKAQAPTYLGPKTALNITGSISTNFPFYGTASFGPAATSANFNGDVVIATDTGASGDSNDGCEAYPANAFNGKIAFINRGTCGFEVKTLNAQAANAAAVIIGNVATSSNPGTAPAMGPTSNTATIPSLSLNLNDANTIRTQGTGMHAALGTVAGQYAGADSGNRPLLYAPSTVAGGSTYSHYDVTLSPNALMEPFINDDLAANFRTDLTLGLFADEGWVLKSGTAKLGSKACDTKVPLYVAPGLMTGANLQAADTLCTASYPTTTGRKSCITGFASKLKAAGLITSAQQTAITNCALRR